MTNIVSLIEKYPLSHKIIKINKIPVEIKTYISAKDFMNVVNDIVEASFSDGVYKPEFRTIAEKRIYLEHFTDIDMGDIKLAELYKVVQSEWFEKIMREIEILPVFCEVVQAVNETIEYRIKNQKSSFDNLCDSLSAVLQYDTTQNLNDIKEVLSGLSKIDKKEFVKAVVDNHIEKN